MERAKLHDFINVMRDFTCCLEEAERKLNQKSRVEVIGKGVLEIIENTQFFINEE